MIVTEKSKTIPISLEVLSDEDMKKLNIPLEVSDIRYCISKYQGKYYYCKFPFTYGLINELIGSYLSKRIELDTVDYQIGITRDGDLVALSELFYKSGFRYMEMYKFLEQDGQVDYQWLQKSAFCLWKCATATLQHYEGTPMFSAILKTIAVDLKMGQCDRNSSNMQVKIDGFGTISLVPLYDYEKAYERKKRMIYANPFIAVKKNHMSLKTLFRTYPELWDYMQYLNSISMKEILGDIAQEKQVSFTEEEKEYYENRQKENDRMIQKIKIK